MLFNGESLTACSTAERTRRGIGRTFQVAQTFATLTVLQNVQLALVAPRAAPLGDYRLLWHLQTEAASSLLAEVGLQRYAAVRRGKPRLWRCQTARTRVRTRGKAPPVADGRADRRHGGSERFALMQTVIDARRSEQMAVLFTEHSMDVVFGFARRVLVLSRGRLIADDVPEAVRADREVQAVYLGQEA